VPRSRAQKREVEEEQAGIRPFWSGTVSFGLVSVPVNLMPATQSTRTSLRMLGPNGEPLARRYYSQKTERDLDADEIVRGYEIKKDKFVVVTDEELERLAPEKSRDIDVRLFVPENSIPPFYFERSYFLLPAANSDKAYRLLAETMEKNELAGIATFVMRGKEYLVSIFAENEILRAETMRFTDEVRSPDDIGLPKKKDAPKATVTKLEKLIKKKSKRQLSRSKLEDDQSENLLKLVKKKGAQHKNVVEVSSKVDSTAGKVVDLVEILKKSLKGK
jgi:DNA end-binding protein Ku